MSTRSTNSFTSVNHPATTRHLTGQLTYLKREKREGLATIRLPLESLAPNTYSFPYLLHTRRISTGSTAQPPGDSSDFLPFGKYSLTYRILDIPSSPKATKQNKKTLRMVWHLSV